MRGVARKRTWPEPERAGALGAGSSAHRARPCPPVREACSALRECCMGSNSTWCMQKQCLVDNEGGGGAPSSRQSNSRKPSEMQCWVRFSKLDAVCGRRAGGAFAAELRATLSLAHTHLIYKCRVCIDCDKVCVLSALCRSSCRLKHCLLQVLIKLKCFAMPKKIWMFAPTTN